MFRCAWPPQVRATLLLLALLAAGCVAPAAQTLDPTPAAPDAEPLAPAQQPTEARATNGSVSILAVFADRTPLAGVKLELGNETRTTDATGMARFDPVAPGSYTLVASKAAHRTAQQHVEVVAGAQTSAEVVLAAESGGQHAHGIGFDAHTDRYVFEGRFDCTAIYLIIPGDCLILVENVTKTAGLPDPVSSTTNETNLIDFPLDVNWTRLVVEMEWNETSPPTADGMTLALEPAEAPSDGHAAKYARVAGGSPLRLELVPGVKHETATQEDMPKPEGGEVLRARAFVKGHAHNPGGTDFLGVGAAVDFRFTLTVSITYG